MICKKHPTYQAKREPRGDCERCWLIWLAKELSRVSALLAALTEPADYDRWGFPL